MGILITIVAIGIILGIIIYKRQQSIEDEEINEVEYNKKESLVSDNELNFYNKLEKIFGDKYKIQTQINLASIIDKKNSHYRNELFRNIDFGLFDKQTLKPLILIELNDNTHKNKNRYKRDLKVRNILKEANIPLVTFYTSYENKESYIKQRLEKILNK